MAIQRLILFDIDGTLVRTQNGYVPFNEAISKTFGVAGDIRTVIPDGNTDPRIVEEIFTKGKIDIKIALDQWELFGTNLHLSYASALQDGRTAIMRFLVRLTCLVCLHQRKILTKASSPAISK